MSIQKGVKNIPPPLQVNETAMKVDKSIKNPVKEPKYQAGSSMPAPKPQVEAEKPLQAPEPIPAPEATSGVPEVTPGGPQGSNEPQSFQDNSNQSE